jgi:hypothetical protein
VRRPDRPHRDNGGAVLAAILAYGALVATLSSTIPSCRQANAQLVDYGWHTQAISPSLGLHSKVAMPVPLKQLLV